MWPRPYRPNIVSDGDFEPSDITHKSKMSDENMEGPEGGIQMLTLPFVPKNREMRTPTPALSPYVISKQVT
jgi:hypothetical protein